MTMDDNDDVSDLTCDPIDSYDDVMKYMDDPPRWAKYCTELKHTETPFIKNADLYNNGTICHLNLEQKDELCLHNAGSLPKTLVCHDMANGYHDDRFIRGTQNYTAYNLYNWSGIDIFCYFSHHFITIPPLGWINAAHRHGVKILGTIITEWNDGFKLCEQILQSEKEYKKFAHIIVAITKYFKLDGWLLNIENKITKPHMLVEFVSYLKNKLHSEVPGTLLIWYDSVTIHGDLKWQNGLTNENKAFFDASDGIFTNYSWLMSHLVESVQLSGERRHDVFVGVDVWGRNFFGGGQFNTALSSNYLWQLMTHIDTWMKLNNSFVNRCPVTRTESDSVIYSLPKCTALVSFNPKAMEAIYGHNLSIAVFAQAWTHEAVDTVQLHQRKYERSLLDHSRPISPMKRKYCNSNNDDNYIRDELFNAFLLRDKAFWNSIWRYLNTRGPSTLPFKTSFCRGQGIKRMICGEVHSNLPWFNLLYMEYQSTREPTSYGYKLIEQPQPDKIDSPSSTENAMGTSQSEKQNEVNENESNEAIGHRNATECFKKRYKLTVKPVITKELPQTAATKPDGRDSRKPPVTRFDLVEDKSQNPCVEQYFDDAFNVKDSVTKKGRSVILAGSEIIDEQAGGSTSRVLHTVHSGSEAEFKQLQKHILVKNPSFYVSRENNTNWQVRYYILDMPNSVISEILCQLGELDGGAMLLGQIGVCEH